jgi:GT2 family glycosyltransferase
MKVDIIIPVHGNWELTQQCLDTLPREAPLHRVIVVDDASPDDTAAQLARRTDVVVVALEQNSGFAAACNAGARRSDADAVLFLNNDTIVPSGTLRYLAAQLEQDATIGALSPRLLYLDGSIQSAGTMLPGPAAMTHMYVHLDGNIPQANQARDDLFLNGAAMMVRREVFERINGFDEVFQNGIEDCDLSLRVWTEGYRCRYEPAVSITHIEGSTRGKRPNDDANRAIFAARWNHVLQEFHRLRWQDPPVLALRWEARDGLDRLVRDRVLDLFKRFGGARRACVRNSVEDTVLRVVAHFDGRAMLRATYGRGPADVRILAPRASGELRDIDARDEMRYWVPTGSARDALLERGVPDQRISTFYLGAPSPSLPASEHREGAVVLVAGSEDPRDHDLAAIQRALHGIPTRIVAYANATAQDLAAVRGASLVVVAAEDPWGFFPLEALAASALVIAPNKLAGLDLFSPEMFVAVDHRSSLADAVDEVRRRFEDYRPRAARAGREAARRIPEIHAGQRLRELARAAKHGIPEDSTTPVTSRIAAKLRGGRDA